MAAESARARPINEICFTVLIRPIKRIADRQVRNCDLCRFPMPQLCE